MPNIVVETGWLRNQLLKLHFSHYGKLSYIELMLMLTSARTKHIDIHIHFVHENAATH